MISVQKGMGSLSSFLFSFSFDLCMISLDTLDVCLFYVRHVTYLRYISVSRSGSSGMRPGCVPYTFPSPQEKEQKERSSFFLLSPGWAGLGSLKRRSSCLYFFLAFFTFLARTSIIRLPWRTCGFNDESKIYTYISLIWRDGVVMGLDSLLREGTFRLEEGLAASRDRLDSLAHPTWKFYRSSPGGDGRASLLPLG